jgi:hypothetical protein
LLNVSIFPYSGNSPKRSRGEEEAAGSDGGGGEGGRGRGRSGRGGGVGRGGRGGGRGGRKTFEERQQERLERHDLVVSRIVNSQGQKASKRGNTGREVQLIANYFAMDKRTDWCIYNYRVDFSHTDLETKDKKKLVRVHERTLGAYIFDGGSLFSSHRLSPDVSYCFCH